MRLDVSVVIPSLTGEVTRLSGSLQGQRLVPVEIELIVGVQPNGRARNMGVARTTGDVLVFVDDDAVLGHERVIENLVEPLNRDLTIGVTGASKLIPPDSSWFQRWIAREVPRIEHPVVHEPLETNPEPENNYYCEVTTTCCAMRRDVFEEVGGFNEELIRGVDTEFLTRVHWYGYRILLVPDTWVYHPAPPNLRALLRKHFLYGIGHSQEVRLDPTRGRGNFFRTRWQALLFILFRTAILIPNAFIPYSYATPQWRLGFTPLKALSSYAAALGYLYGWYRYPMGVA